MTLSPTDILALLGAVQGTFVALMLYQRKVSNRPAANYLLALVLLVSFLLLAKLSFQPDWMLTYSEIILLPDAILFTFGPCLWLFVRHLLRLPALSSRQLAWHALPAFIHVVVLNTVLGQHLSQHWHFLHRDQIIFAFYSIEGGGIISLFAYILASLRLLQGYQQQLIPTQITPTAAAFLPTFFRIGLLLAGAWGLSFLIHIVAFDPKYTAYQVFWFLLVAYVYWLAYMVLLKTELFDLPPAPKTITDADEMLIQKIEEFMQQHEPYLEPSLKLGDLAESLDLPRHELSRLLNHGFGQSFFDFINTYRIRAFIKQYQESAQAEWSIMQLAYQVGFNSKSAFNRAFRKVTDSSPSDYFNEQAVDHSMEDFAN